VRVWYAPVHAMGIKSFATYGFILPAKSSQMPAAPDTIQPAITQLAMADTHR
jgi:hypothetical protein